MVPDMTMVYLGIFFFCFSSFGKSGVTFISRCSVGFHSVSILHLHTPCSHSPPRFPILFPVVSNGSVVLHLLFGRLLWALHIFFSCLVAFTVPFYHPRCYLHAVGTASPSRYGEAHHSNISTASKRTTAPMDTLSHFYNPLSFAWNEPLHNSF